MTRCTALIIGLIMCQNTLSWCQIDLHPVSSGFNQPVGIAHAGDGSGRLFIVEQAGRIKVVSDLSSGIVATEPLLHIVSKVSSGSELGMLGMCFHPQYPQQPYFYVYYTRGSFGNRKSVIERYTMSSLQPMLVDTSSALQIIEIDQPYENHNAGDIKFGQDGYLYVPLGDGGSGGDPLNHGQNPMTLLGSLLRLDVDQDDFPADPSRSYGIPPTNPFVSDSTYASEIWAIGLRNPWRFSFDRNTGDMWIGDVGQSSREEVNKQPSTSSGGENYGWSCKEGSLSPTFHPCLSGPLTDPVFEYGRTEGWSLTGGFVYRGDSFKALQGYYICADYGSGRWWKIKADDPSKVQSMQIISEISSFGESESGELYAVHRGSGTLYRVMDADACPDIFQVTTHSDTLYAAQSTLSSDVVISAMDKIIYVAPDVLLDPPFAVGDEGKFLIFSEACKSYIQRTRY